MYNEAAANDGMWDKVIPESSPRWYSDCNSAENRNYPPFRSTNPLEENSHCKVHSYPSLLSVNIAGKMGYRNQPGYRDAGNGDSYIFNPFIFFEAAESSIPYIRALKILDCLSEYVLYETVALTDKPFVIISRIWLFESDCKCWWNDWLSNGQRGALPRLAGGRGNIQILFQNKVIKTLKRFVTSLSLIIHLSHDIAISLQRETVEYL